MTNEPVNDWESVAGEVIDAAKELKISLKILAEQVRFEAKTNERWDGTYEAVMPHIERFDAALSTYEAMKK